MLTIKREMREMNRLFSLKVGFTGNIEAPDILFSQWKVLKVRNSLWQRSNSECYPEKIKMRIWLV